MAVNRKKLTTSLPSPLITLMEQIAKRKKWDVDLVHEEAIVYYVNQEMGKTEKKKGK